MRDRLGSRALVWLTKTLAECHLMTQYRLPSLSAYSVYGCARSRCWGRHRLDSFELGNSLDRFDNLGGKCWDNSNRHWRLLGAFLVEFWDFSLGLEVYLLSG